MLGLRTPGQGRLRLIEDLSSGTWISAIPKLLLSTALVDGRVIGYHLGEEISSRDEPDELGQVLNIVIGEFHVWRHGIPTILSHQQGVRKNLES